MYSIIFRFLEFTDAKIHSSSSTNLNKNSQQMNLPKIIKQADEEIRRMIIISKQRNISLAPLFAHEFTPAPLSLCDSQNIQLLNQQSKATVISFIKELYPSAFQDPVDDLMKNSALIIDGGSLLETKPLSHVRTISDYAEQLLVRTIGHLFTQHVSNYIDESFVFYREFL